MSGLPKQCPSCGGFCGTTPCSYGETSASDSNELLCGDIHSLKSHNVKEEDYLAAKSYNDFLCGKLSYYEVMQLAIEFRAYREK